MERSFNPAQGFQNGCVCRGVRNRSVACDGFHLVDCRLVGSSDERFFNPPMLVAERNFKMQHFFSSALKSKMSRLDDAGMNWANGNFMDFAAADAEELAIGRRIAAAAPYGFEPGMTFWFESVLLPNFTFKEMSLNVRDR